MGDEPRFPSPDEARKERSVYREAASRPSEPVATPRVVSRPEPIPPTEPPVTSTAVRLTAEEIRAIANLGTNERKIASAIWQRGRVVAIPTGVIALVFNLVLGRSAPFVVTGVVFLAILWTARPLFERHDGS